MQPSNIIANRAARYRSVVRLYAEALGAGALDESLVPEIETAFAELGQMVDLDFEEVRREAGGAEARERKVGPGSPTGIQRGARNDVLLIADLPDSFSWTDVAQVWGVNRRTAFYRINKLLDKNLIYVAGMGTYRVSGRRKQEGSAKSAKVGSAKSAKSAKVESAIQAPESPKLESPKPSSMRPAPGGPSRVRTSKKFQVFDFPLDQIRTDPPRFQPRGRAFSEESAQRVAEDKHPELMEPIWLWHDKADGQDYVLAGHSRLEGFRRRGEVAIPGQFFQGTEKAAIAFSWTENDKGTSLSNAERARYLRNYRECCALSKTDVRKEAERLYDKNASTVVSLSHLNQDGAAMQTLRAFESNSTGEARDAETMAVWVGKLRSVYGDLTDSHEREAFDYLKNNYKTAGRRLRCYAAFREFVDQVVGRRTVFGVFEADKPLNFADVKPESMARQRVNELLERLRAVTRETRAERDEALRGLLARREAGEHFDMDRVMKPHREAVEASEHALLQAEQESRAALDHLKGTEFTLFGNPRRRASRPGIDFDVQYSYVGEVEEFVSTTARIEDAELLTTPSRDVALIVPKSRAKQGRGRGRFSRAALKAYKEFHGRAPTGRDFMVSLPMGGGHDAGEAVLLIYTTDKGGQEEYLFHFFDIGPPGASRPVRRVGDVFVIEGLEMTFYGIMN